MFKIGISVKNPKNKNTVIFVIDWKSIFYYNDGKKLWFMKWKNMQKCVQWTSCRRFDLNGKSILNKTTAEQNKTSVCRKNVFYSVDHDLILVCPLRAFSN